MLLRGRVPRASLFAWPRSAYLVPGRTTQCLSTSAGDSSFEQVAHVPRRRTRGQVFTLLVPALEAFYASKGHFLVPYHYPIPSQTSSEDESNTGAIVWPADAHGMNLGRTLHAFMTNKNHHKRFPRVVTSLRAIGFPVDVDWKQYLWKELFMAGLETFYRQEGHSLVPIHFVVPSNDARWPRQTWGHRLGTQVHAIRQKLDALDPIEREDLERVDFSKDVNETVWSEKLLPALETFAAIHGHCVVKHTFVVPSEEPWPRKTWGLNLGLAVNSLRVNRSYSEQIARDADRLNEIGFVWNVREDKWKEVVRPSLEVFAQQHGHCRVERAFVVPSEAPWPEKAWGFRLGHAVNHIRSKGSYAKEIAEDEQLVKTIGFVWDLRQDKWHEMIFPSIEVFVSLYGHCHIHRSFVVPAMAPWPAKAWGFRLGIAVHDIRYENAYADLVGEYQDRLRAIGFLQWVKGDPKRTPRALF
ncbi:hypothetical protein Poli38472_012743 [Pythium oligandrum]|uniref:Helicase-associated domain-containing protein n=1 Tax=Pythium oligandrum TaxID=41045 RepID=A0A8K1CE04_PYTOL|nr:hypothetical protein Poli38472_012743 [Pythium oligandrum]|eukprot:TMW61552.1 hypothetical protein Poli38472_012743 [Pythium oligandrum]